MKFREEDESVAEPIDTALKEPGCGTGLSLRVSSFTGVAEGPQIHLPTHCPWSPKVKYPVSGLREEKKQEFWSLADLILNQAPWPWVSLSVSVFSSLKWGYYYLLDILIGKH